MTSCDPQVYVHDCRVTEGRLLVEVRECSRLGPVDGAMATYCTVGIGTFVLACLIRAPFVETTSQKRTQQSAYLDTVDSGLCME